MDFAALPPEVNSGLMYTGAGAGPMLAAGAAWEGLAAELHSAATAYESVVSELTAWTWLGPSSATMSAAVAPYIMWLNTTAGQAENTATRAKVAVAAYEAAFALTVPPPVIAANRAELMMLTATNFWGQNSAAIAATEAHYGEMWAQDATAMNGYAAAAPKAADLQPFAPPPQIANSAGPLSQTAAIEQGSAGSVGQSAASQLASAAQADPPGLPFTSDIVSSLDFFSNVTLFAPQALALSMVATVLAGAAMHFAELDSREILDTQDLLRGGQKSILESLEQLGVVGELPGTENLRVPHASVVSAPGESFPVGALSVPPSWVQAAPEIRNAGFSSPLAAPAVSPGGYGTAFSQMALAGMAGSALSGAVGSGRQRGASTIAERPDLSQLTPAPLQPTAASQQSPESLEQSPESPAESPQQSLVSPVARLVIGLNDLDKLRGAGLLTEEEFLEQKQRLLSR